MLRKLNPLKSHRLLDNVSVISLTNVLMLSCTTVVFCCLCIKAGTASFTHDEAFTFLHYPKDSFLDILSMKNSFNNNHILNSLLIKLSVFCFGISEWSIRLPNVIGFLIFVFYLLNHLGTSNMLLKFCIFILLMFNNNLIEFFSLARGYGISIAFMMGAVFYLRKLLMEKGTRNIFLFHFFSLLAILSHFNLISFYFPVCGLILLHEINCGLKRSSICKNIIYAHGLSMIMVIVMLFEPFRRLLKYNHLNAGGSNGFLEDTGTSVISSAFPQLNYHPVVINICLFAICGIVLISSIFSAYRYLEQNNSKMEISNLFIHSNLLLLIAIFIILSHHIFGISYPILRFSLFLVPLSMLFIYYFLSAIAEKINKKLIPMILLSFSIFTLFHFFLNFNLTSFSEWSFDSKSKEASQALEIYIQENNLEEKLLTLGVHPEMAPTMEFYRNQHQISSVSKIDFDVFTFNEDLYYTYKADLENLEYLQYQIIKEFPETGTALARNSNY